MLLLGLLLLAVAVVVGVELVLANRAPMTIHLWNWDWNVHAYGLAAWGGAIVLVAVLGLLMMSSAAGRKRRLRRERRELAAENRDLSVRADRAERVARGEVPAGRGRRVGRRRRQEQEREAEAAAASGAFTSDSMRHQRAVGPDWTAGQPAARRTGHDGLPAAGPGGLPAVGPARVLPATTELSRTSAARREHARQLPSGQRAGESGGVPQLNPPAALTPSGRSRRPLRFPRRSRAARR